MALTKLLENIKGLGRVCGDKRMVSENVEMRFCESDEFIKRAIHEWAHGDPYFRRVSPSMVSGLNNSTAKTMLVVFRRPGLDCYFGYPECRTTVLTRLGITGGDNAGYGVQIRAAHMMYLADAGFEFMGILVAQDILDYNKSVNRPPETRNFAVDKSLIGKVVNQVEHVGFKVDPLWGGENKWLLVPKTHFQPKAGD